MKTVLVGLTCFVLGFGIFYGFTQYQKLQEENKNLKMKLQDNVSPSATPQKEEIVPTAEPATSLKVKPGSIQGTLGYPSSGIPELTVYAFSTTDEKKFYSVETTVNQTTFEIPGMEQGTYHVVAYPKEYAVSGGYTKAVSCGLSVDCKDHSLVDVVVTPGETTKGVEVKDWYAPDGTFPKKP